MIRNYLRSAWRGFCRHKGHSFINLAGFALGMSCCVAILLYVRNERSYDAYHKDVERVFRISMDIRNKASNRLFAPISDTAGPALEAGYPQVEAAIRILPSWTSRLVKRGDVVSYEDRFVFADAKLFSVLTIPLVKGDPGTALARPRSLVVAESLARKYFGAADPMGKTLNVNGQDYGITAVAADPPGNAHLKYGLIASMATIANEDYMNNWHSTMFYTYLKLKPGVDAAAFSKLVSRLADKYVKARLDAWGTEYHYFLQPVRGLHLAAPLRYEIEPPSNPVALTILSVVGLFTLLIAALNFMNLATARSANRAREVGLRKVVGAEKKQLVVQFLGEAVLFALAALALALLVVRLMIPALNGLTGAGLRWPLLFTPATLAILLGGAVLAGLTAGLYPAFLLSSFRPAVTLKAGLSRGRGGLIMRTVLVVLQFSISSALIVGTLFMQQQFRFMKGQNLGFAKEQKLVVPLRGGISVRDNYAAVKNSFLSNPAITGAAFSSTVPGRTVSNFAIKIVGQADDRNQSMFHLYFDDDFVPLYGISMAVGRAFQKELATDVAGAFLINEAAVKAFGWSRPEEALGKRLETGNGGRTLPIIGVTKDFHYRGLQAQVEPLVMEFNPERLAALTLEIEAANVAAAQAFIERQWRETFPGRPFESFFLDADFDRQYQADERVGRIFGIFMILGLFVACLGLFGLASFTAESRTREVGVRKVLGASASNIVVLLSRQFAVWVLAANFIAWPAAYLFVSSWLRNFAARTPIGAGTFLLSGLAVLAIALLTTGLQTVRAALANPAVSLKHE
jgi:putative ABC transport system permease protein